MSRIGKKPVEVPAGVKVTIENGVVELEGHCVAVDNTFLDVAGDVGHDRVGAG